MMVPAKLTCPQNWTLQYHGYQVHRDIQRLKTKIAEIDFHQSQIQLLTAKTSQLQQEKNALKLQGSSGSTSFPIWGRKSCPAMNGTETVYTGITGVKHYTHPGSGTNTLCMPHDPDSLPSDFPSTTFSGFEAYVYGAEYQFTYKNVAIDDDVPCVICIVTPAATTMMVPAKLTCPQNWTLQYHGYLGAGYHRDHASEFICIDSDPEYFEGLRLVNSNGPLIYPVRMDCGSLPCPKYKQYQFVSCAVCTF
ncbi:uncharacterized protein LOC144621234 [Crassostrea virginica]